MTEKMVTSADGHAGSGRCLATGCEREAAKFYCACGASHSRGPIEPGGTAFRCFACGYSGPNVGRPGGAYAKFLTRTDACGACGHPPEAHDEHHVPELCAGWTGDRGAKRDPLAERFQPDDTLLPTSSVLLKQQAAELEDEPEPAIDAETAALFKVVSALRDLDRGAQARVAGYVYQRFSEDL